MASGGAVVDWEGAGLPQRFFVHDPRQGWAEGELQRGEGFAFRTGRYLQGGVSNSISTWVKLGRKWGGGAPTSDDPPS